ncbi:type VI secretion system tube protein Hcp [Neisseriaceae bacterium TC5R-5]|nr:type VI secretion system tube protein Hcp [Neisseriaceae bacterium TC5R-5]
MAQDIFLKINGIDGESEDADHKAEIEVLGWNWAVSQVSNMHSGSGGGSGKASVEDFQFQHYVDRASPNLIQYCLTGKHIDQCVLTVRKAGGKPLEYLKLTMEEVIIARVAPNGSAADQDRPLENVRLSFARLRHEYVIQNAQGGSGGAITASFDIKKNIA